MSRALTLGRRLDLALRVVRIPDGLDPADYVLSPAGAEGFRELVGRAQTLLQFHVRLALESNDLGRSDGRARAFVRLKEVLGEAATPMERDEELRFIADRMGLSDEAVGYLLRGDGRAVVGGAAAQDRRPAAGPVEGDSPAADVAKAAMGGSHELEVRFLAGCLARPATAREILAGVDEGFFAGPETRAAFRLVKARLEGEGAGNILHTTHDGDAEEEKGEAFAEVIVRAGRERFSEAVLRELFLRLQEARVSRLIARLKLAGEEATDQGRRDELARLYAVRLRLREAIRATPVDDEPDEG
jgi:DNA primase